MQLKASAPGSLMLLGEYAVLHGHAALLCAVDKRLTVTLTPRVDHTILLTSDRYAPYETTVSDLQLVNPYAFVLQALQLFVKQLPSGCAIYIESDFSDQIGFGSSAAIVSAMLSALNDWLSLKLMSIDLVRYGRQVIQHVQEGRGSGADCAASVYGGIVSYRMQPLIIEQFSTLHPIVTCYAGFKTKTSKAIQQIESRFASHPRLFQAIINAIGECASDGIDCVRISDWKTLGQLFTVQQPLMSALGVSTPILDTLVKQLQQTNTILGAKISGAGLGDCVLGLGQAMPSCVSDITGTSFIPVSMSESGVICERYE